ncbi:CvpA family protein [Parabacteroides sp. 52]|uniref:CvpA family protein n=1 Tax=unclassified Parabacteroides TaxID=2649774 RepID=UPI0013D4B1F0|nr:MULTISPECIES: CvpA family protein [unclassified Parabacteroides]MDH6535208.1 membrane protein required for colicin V production [Parabacteroides sp. PM5-20]NDV56304.1 CvpA family protein [Parabacteroides sp. 52]
MNWLDIVIVCLAGIGIVKGLFDGIIKQVVSLIALGAGIFFCGKAAVWLKEYIIGWGVFPPESITVVSYVLGFLVIVGLLLLAGEIVHRVIGATPLSILNHLLGGVFGILVMLLFLSLAFNLIEQVDKHAVCISSQAKAASRLYDPVKEIVPTIFPHNLFITGN